MMDRRRFLQSLAAGAAVAAVPGAAVAAIEAIEAAAPAPVAEQTVFGSVTSCYCAFVHSDLMADIAAMPGFRAKVGESAGSVSGISFVNSAPSFPQEKSVPALEEQGVCSTVKLDDFRKAVAAIKGAQRGQIQRIHP